MKRIFLQIKKEVPVRLEKNKLEKLAEESLAVLKKNNKQYEISLVFVSQGKIKSLNRAYCKRDMATDVLSFAAGSGNGFKKGSDREYLGDIIICPARARQQARAYGNSFSVEIKKLFVHGFLHLFNFDHKIAKDSKAMQGLEEKILKKL